MKKVRWKENSLGKGFKEKLMHLFVPLLGFLLLRFIYGSSRKKFVIKGEMPDEPVIIACWHGELGLPPFFMMYKLRKNRKNFMMISEHKDGELIARTMKYIGHDAVRGSSSRGGAKALLNAIKKLKEGYDIAITPDGPRGPRHQVADGIVAIAQRQKCKIVAVGFEASRYWQFNSWDKFTLPKPFSTITFYASEPFSIDGMEKEEAKQLIHDKLERAC